MKQLQHGEFYGQTNETIHLEGITLTDTVYTHDYVDWHYHENAYFTFLLQGQLLEGNRKEVYHCGAGTLLFHHWQEPHYNIKPKGLSRGFHIELKQQWAADFAFDLHDLQGSLRISNPDLQLLFYKIFRETKIQDDTAALSIQSLLLQVLTGMQGMQQSALKYKPLWVSEIKEMLHEQRQGKLSLTTLSDSLNIHPVHLSRDFPRYFQCNLGEYIRKLKVEKALSLLPDRENTLTQIAFACGFSDQSHFIRCFREIMGMSPLAYRKIMLSAR